MDEGKDDDEWQDEGDTEGDDEGDDECVQVLHCCTDRGCQLGLHDGQRLLVVGGLL